MCNTAFLLLTLLPGLEVPPPDLSLTDLEKAVLSPRRSIRRGVVSLEANISWSNSIRDNDRSTTIWFDYDKNRIRSDVVNHWKNRQEPVYRHIQCSNCERPDYYVDYEEKPLDNAVVAVTLAPLTADRKKRLTENFDPRMLGLVPFDSIMLRNHHFESVLGRTDRGMPKVRRDRWKEMDCWVVSFHDRRGTYFEYWVVPSQGYNVARNIVESHPEGKPYRVTVETEAAPVGSTGIWFPRSCVCEVTNDGKFVRKEVLRVTKISLNEPVDGKVFTLAGMNIAADTPIAGVLPNGQGHAWTWTGKAVVDHVNEFFHPEPPQKQGRGWLIALAISCAVVATVALGLYFRRRRLTASTG